VVESAKVLVDSSVWIDFLRGSDPAVRGIRSLAKGGHVVICGQILQEVLQGARDSKSFVTLEQQMSVWPYEPEIPEDYVQAARIFSSLRWKGVTVPPSDCLIAAIAIRLNLSLYSHDPDFERIPNLNHYTP
jgi:predicted nucleic acid-binding protein